MSRPSREEQLEAMGVPKMTLEEAGQAAERASDLFRIKTDDKRMEFESGMVRSPSGDRTDFVLIRTGPMFVRWAEHLTKGAEHYGKDNWTLATGDAELQRFKESAARHFEQWLADMRDEDHAAAVFFNINGAEYVRDRNRHRPES